MKTVLAATVLLLLALVAIERRLRVEDHPMGGAPTRPSPSSVGKAPALGTDREVSGDMLRSRVGRDRVREETDGSAATHQSGGSGKAKALFSKFERTGQGLDELMAVPDEVFPLALARTRARRPGLRRSALELLGRIDLQDDGVLNRDEVLAAMLGAIDGPEQDPVVVDIALRFLQYVDPRKIGPGMIGALLTQLANDNAKAARILGQTGDPSLIPALEPYASASDEAVADLATQALDTMQRPARFAMSRCAQ